jgi:uncharacterized protein (TIGR03118 family)
MKRFSLVLSPSGLLAVCLMAAAMGLFVVQPAAAQYRQHNLVSDIPLLADHLDPNLVNPWGISSSPTSPFWISDNGTGVTTLYNGSGVPQALVVTIPPPAGGTPPSAPTGQVFASGLGFNLVGSASPALFIFAAEDGTISGWNATAGTSAIRKVDNSGTGAIYKGLAVGSNGSANFLYAANFHAGTIDVFDTSFASTTLAGSFTDPNLPSGFAPFNIQNINGNLYVTYAKQDALGQDDVAGAGNGFVDVYDTNGNFLKRLISQGSLNSPWGLALATANFGAFSNDLLVGNFGDGLINAFDPTTGAFLGSLEDSGGNSILIEGLWGLKFGNSGVGFDPNTLYFTAGIPGDGQVEDHGLFGSISVPEPPMLTLLGLGLIGLGGLRRRFKE